MKKRKTVGRPKKIVLVVPGKQEDFTISLKLGNDIVQSRGETLLDALTKLPKPQKIRLRGLLTITSGEKKLERMLNVPQIKRLFYSVARFYQAKILSSYLK